MAKPSTTELLKELFFTPGDTLDKVRQIASTGIKNGKGSYETGFGASGKDTAELAALAYLNGQLKNSSLWNSLSDAEKKATINSSYGDPDSFLGIKTYESDLDSIISDFNNADSILSGYSLGPAPDFDAVSKELLDNYYQPIYDRIDAEQSDMRGVYNQQLKSSNDYYNNTARGLLSNQARQNASIQESLRSDISRTRQNALEAGASAGLRIAGNVNATLAAQNKAAQTSMDTSNNLAQMLLNQRQAAAGIRSDYQNYLTGSNRYRDSVQQDYMDRRTSEYNTRRGAYNDKVSDMENQVHVGVGDQSYAYPYVDRYMQNKTVANK